MQMVTVLLSMITRDTVMAHIDNIGPDFFLLMVSCVDLVS